MKHRSSSVALVLGAGLVLALGWATISASAATITASYRDGYRDVVINGYGADGLGTFALRDGDRDEFALCIEANVGHTTASGAYAPVANSVASPELDALLWWLDRQPSIDDDTGVAAAALAWYYAGATRTIGPPVWSDGHRGFEPIGPLAPESWDALAPFTTDHMIGLVAGGRHLDAAERRVAALHRLATSLAGPWKLAADRDSTSFTLVGSAGPLPRRRVTVTIEPPNGDPETRVVMTDQRGRAAIDVSGLADGATVRASADAPGVHREWDGGVGVQRMATPTPATVEASFEVAPLPRHIELIKRSTDPTIGVAGARFELRDANGSAVATATSDASGVARFGPIDPLASPAPYEVVEVEAPAGLVAADEPIVVREASTNPDLPTVIEVDNPPATAELAVRKQLSMPEAGPADRSGFRFLATRREDGAEHELETGPDGTTGRVSVPLGTYDVCETATPPWASSTNDGGCVQVVVDPGVLTEAEFVVDYQNLVPEPGIDTLASDADDGDRELSSEGGTIVDQVVLADLVAGTEYRLDGEIIALGDEAVPTGIQASTEFTADDSEAEIELTFEVPAMATGQVVVVERLSVRSSSDGEWVVVAEHANLDDADQTVTVIAPPTTTTTSTTTTTTTTTSTTVAPTTTAVTTTVPPSTSTSTTTTSPPTTEPPPTPTTVPSTPPSTLPPTGSGAAALLRLGDAGFILGVALVTLAGLLPRRRTTRTN